MSHDFPGRLKPKQRQAAELLAQNLAYSSIAKRLRMRRETLSRWQKNPLFVAETERCRLANQAEARARLDGLFDLTIIALSENLQSWEHSGKTALALLKLLGADQVRDAMVRAALPAPYEP